MALRELEKLKSALVLVPPEGQFSLNLDPAEVARYLREPELMKTGEGLPQITSVRDQVVVVVGPKIVFEDRSDVIPPAASRLPDVVNGFVQIFRRQGLERYRAYGWNFDVAFDAPGEEPAASLIANSFLDARVLSDRAGIHPVGAGVRMFFEQSEARCDLRLESRHRDLNTPRFFAHINYHYELDPPGSPPDLDNLRVAYHGLWGSFVDLLTKLVKP